MSDSKRRTRLNLPLRLSQFSSQLCQKVRSIFPEIQDSNLYYVDGEGESIIVDADANLVEARDLFKGIGRVPSFVVKKAAPPPQSSSKPRSKQVFRSIAHVRSVTTVYEFPVGKICGNRTIAKPSTAMIIIAMIAIFVTACVTESFGTQCRQSVDVSADDSFCSLHQHKKCNDIKNMYVIAVARPSSTRIRVRNSRSHIHDPEQERTWQIFECGPSVLRQWREASRACAVDLLSHLIRW